MHQALLLVPTPIARAHEEWRRHFGRRHSLSGKIAMLEERIARLEAEGALLRSRFLRIRATSQNIRHILFDYSTRRPRASGDRDEPKQSHRNPPAGVDSLLGLWMGTSS